MASRHPSMASLVQLPCVRITICGLVGVCHQFSCLHWHFGVSMSRFVVCIIVFMLLHCVSVVLRCLLSVLHVFVLFVVLHYLVALKHVAENVKMSLTP